MALSPLVQRLLEQYTQQSGGPGGGAPGVTNQMAIPQQALANAAPSAVGTAPASGVGGSLGLTTGNVNTDALKKYAQQRLAQMGWTDPAQWQAFDQLISHESGWRPTAQNPTSTAYGLGQFLDTTWAGVGGQKTSDPYKQIDYVTQYIKNRSDYGDPATAWAKWQQRSPHWY